MTNERLKELRAHCDAVESAVAHYERTKARSRSPKPTPTKRKAYQAVTVARATLVGEARTDIPLLLSHIEGQAKAVQGLVEALEKIEWLTDGTGLEDEEFDDRDIVEVEVTAGALRKLAEALKAFRGDE